MVLYDEKDLHLLLLANSKYELNVEGNRETEWQLDLDGMEKAVVERYTSNCCICRITFDKCLIK